MRAVLFAAASLVCSAAPAQPPGDSAGSGPLAAPQPVIIEPVYEGGVRNDRGLHIPANLRLAPEQRLTLGYTASNSYLNPGLLVCADRSCELEYESDHTGNLLHLSFRRPLFAAFELGVTGGTYQMNNIAGFSPVHQLASDEFLDFFHQEILREDSLPALSNAPDGRQVFSMTDLDGRRLTLEPERFYALPLRLDLTRYVEIRQTSRVRMGLNAGLHVAVPLEGDVDSTVGRTAFSRGVDLGLSANFVRVRRLTANLSSTFHVQLARFRNDVHVSNPNSPLHGDDDMRSRYALTYGLRFDGTFEGRAPCSFGVSQLTVSASFDKDRYWAWDPLVFAGGNNVRGALLGANDYGVLSFGCEFRGRQYQVSLVEDIGGLSQVFFDDGSGTSYDPDFAVGVAVAWVIGSKGRRH
ncbi:MAG: hypothetical protein PVH89_03470 [Gammaproteobacteria bacterium]|jgi:hypothetical protein